MKALELEAYKKLVYKDIPKPTPGPEELLIKVEACGICGSDVHGFDGSTGRRIPPVVMGHEAAGVVEELGPGAEGFSVGDRVTFDSTLSCGHCYYCRRGQINFCENRRVLGVSCDEYRQNGAFAEHVVVPARVCYPLPEELSFVDAALTEPLSIAVHGVEITPLAVGDSVLVVGAGMIGLLTIAVLRARGCGRIYASDIDGFKLEKAKEFGADITIDASKENVEEAIRRRDRHGVAAALDAVGNTPSINSAIPAIRRGGTMTLIGNLSPKIEVPLQVVVSRQIRLQGSNASSGEYPACLELLRQGAINTESFVSAVAPLSEGVDWFERLYNAEKGLLKVVLDPNR